MTEVEVGPYRFRCEDPIEIARAQTLFTKEEGTIRWLERSCRAGDVLYDIGANIGLYTVIGARAVGPTGLVVAFEPSPANAAALMRNVRVNGVTRSVRLLTVALHAKTGFSPFLFSSLRAGASGHQLDQVETPPVAAVGSEIKYVTTADQLVQDAVIPAPTLIKIDVDGQEPAILEGLWNVLTKSPPRSIQVEIQPTTRDVVHHYLETCGYRFIERHDTQIGARRIAQGIAPHDVAHNAIFEPV